jgi:glycosyltransferase involved in cell wall biosynthesis
MPDPRIVSVIIATYNQEAIVGRAIESALRQITDFPVEVVVGEDCSTDNTRAVVSQYAMQYPDRVRVLANPENLFIQRNMVSMMRAAEGRYIAWLDGDDYWTDPAKLQMQVEFLEANPSYSACCHNVRLVTVEGQTSADCYPGVPAGEKTLEDLIVENFVASPSIVFRNRLVDRIPDWYFTDSLTDWPLWMILAQEGPFMHFADVMADYTLQPRSTWSSRGRLYQCEVEIEFYRRCRTFLPPRYSRLIAAAEAVRHERQSREYIAEGDWDAARRSALLAASVPDWRDQITDKSRILLEAWTPSLMTAIRRVRGSAS